jgi:hypothetical protein
MPTTKLKAVTVYLRPELLERIKYFAAQDLRTVSNFIATWLDVSAVDGVELREKMNSEALPPCH